MRAKIGFAAKLGREWFASAKLFVNEFSRLFAIKANYLGFSETLACG
jgi:hypothetical protein